MTIITETANTKIILIEVAEETILKSVNFYIVERNQSLFLIDAGYNTDTYWKHLEATFQKHGYQLRDLTAILLTHHHPDHVGLVYRIAELHDVPIYIHPYAIPKLKRDPEYLYMSYKFFKDLLYKLNCGEFGKQKIEEIYKRQLNDEAAAVHWNFHEIKQDSIFDFHIIHIPGHAPDQVAFYLADEDILFSGDLLVEHQAISPFVEPFFDGTRMHVFKQQQAALKKIIHLNPKLVLPGHGAVITNSTKLAEHRLHMMMKKAQSFLSLIENGIATGNEMVKQRHPVKYEKIFFTVMRDALSFLDYLEDEGKIVKEEKNGIWHYAVNHIANS